VALAIWNEVKSSNRQGCDCFPSLAMTVNIFVQLLKLGIFSHLQMTFAMRLGIWLTPRYAIIPRRAMGFTLS
jgi:hypothetical protein